MKMSFTFAFIIMFSGDFLDAASPRVEAASRKPSQAVSSETVFFSAEIGHRTKERVVFGQRTLDGKVITTVSYLIDDQSKATAVIPPAAFNEIRDALETALPRSRRRKLVSASTCGAPFVLWEKIPKSVSANLCLDVATEFELQQISRWWRNVRSMAGL